MGQVKRRIENIEGAIAKLVIGELGLLVGVVFIDNDEAASMRCGADGVVNNAAVQHGFCR